MMHLKIIKLKFISFFILLLSQHVCAQTSSHQATVPFKVITENFATKTPRISSNRKNTISGTLGFFDPWIGMSYERLFFSRWGMDTSLGLIGGSIGTKLYFPKVTEGKLSFLIGISEGILLLVGTKHYIPAGITYLGTTGFRFSIDLGPQIYHDYNNEVQFGMSLKLGQSF